MEEDPPEPLEGVEARQLGDRRARPRLEGGREARRVRQAPEARGSGQAHAASLAGPAPSRGLRGGERGAGELPSEAVAHRAAAPIPDIAIRVLPLLASAPSG